TETITSLKLGATTINNLSTSDTGVFGTWSHGGGSDGTNACAGPAPTFTGTFATSTVATINNNVASNIALAINACPAAFGVTASASTNTVKVVHTKPGTFLAVAVPVAGNFSWGSVTNSVGAAVTNGSTSCTSNTT